MCKLTTTLITCLVFSSAFAQKKLPAFGDVDMSEMTMTSCEFDPNAPAVVLFDQLNVDFAYYSDGPRIKTEQHVRIKVFNERGFRYAMVKIPYLNLRGIAKLKQLRAVVYNLNARGKIEKSHLDRDDFFKEKLHKYIGAVNFTFPELKAGSVVEFTYTRVEDRLLHLYPWVIQSEIPVLYSSYAVQTPMASAVYKIAWGTDSIAEKNEHIKFGNFNKVTYFKERIPAFVPEPFMSSRSDHFMRVNFMLVPRGSYISRRDASMPAWQESGNSVLKDYIFTERIFEPIDGTERIVDSALAISPLADRINFVFQRVKRQVAFNKERSYNPAKLADAWSNRSGNSAEINLILLNLLQRAGITCYPMLVSTRENGKVNLDFPSMAQLNHVDVVALDSARSFVLDASLKYQTSDCPPFNVLNRQGLLLRENNCEWLLIDDDRPLFKEEVVVASTFTANNRIEGNITGTHYNYSKTYLLDSLAAIESNPGRKGESPAIPGLQVKAVVRENLDDDSKPLLQKFTFTYEPQQTGDFYFIKPLHFFSERQNPFIAESRATEIDFGSRQELSLKFTIILPAEVSVDAMPGEVSIIAADSSFRFQRKVKSAPQSITLEQTFEVLKPVFDKYEYPGLRAFFQKAYALMAEEIVLKKKN